MKIEIHHLTCHHYDHSVGFGEHKLFLRPRDGQGRTVLEFAVETTPHSSQRWVSDAYGNVLLLCNFGLVEANRLEISARMLVALTESNPFDFILEPYATAYPFSYREPDRQALLPFLGREATPGAMRVLDWFNGRVSQPAEHPSVMQFLSELNQVIRRDVSYVRRDEEGIQDPDLTLELRQGSCRDMAVLFTAVTRQLGFAARFVSGYLYNPSGAGTDPDRSNRARESMHAWAEVYLPGAGWRGFDPTNGILANELFIPCGVSHEPASISPIQGAYFSDVPANATIEVELVMREQDAE